MYHSSFSIEGEKRVYFMIGEIKENIGEIRGCLRQRMSKEDVKGCADAIENIEENLEQLFYAFCDVIDPIEDAPDTEKAVPTIIEDPVEGPSNRPF